ncbi:hypothetical protein I316_06662 [Kwoniella heveanensis BCC8398]|uniref:DUF7918 domain-containing protein n=1 Tax=Kwoniella heveanensis BCC8398 TaxID=1296120 RepID=A0A1B9GKY1_9TREE|nr:hypothetical protein I316_06662 [Kwoniella heveanensis BCC8398]
MRPVDSKTEAAEVVNMYSFRRHASRAHMKFLFKYRPRHELVRLRIIDEPEEEADMPLAIAGPSKKRNLDASTYIDLARETDNDDPSSEDDLGESGRAKRSRKIEHLEAWVEGKDNKKRLNEHQIQYHPARDGQSAYTECYLETIDETFRIVVEKLPQLHFKSDWRCRVYIDGAKLRNSVWQAKDDRYEKNSIQRLQGGSTIVKSSLRFAPLMTTDDPAKITLTGQNLQQMGSIEVTLQRGLWRFSARGLPDTAQLHQGIADEKGKKTADDKTEAVQEVNRYTFTSSGPVYYRFLFKYRPRAELIRIKIVDEPEAEVAADATASQPGPSRKRIRLSDPIDLTLSEDELDVDVKPELEVDKKDVKPSILAKRNAYLEARVQELIAENKRPRRGSKKTTPTIDLTLDGEVK